MEVSEDGKESSVCNEGENRALRTQRRKYLEAGVPGDREVELKEDFSKELTIKC